ncbi:hypothetical protein DTO166G4_9020 [Paecilomyces variotii]|nr:hypothetical protein DTO166G4_9020 [Paecilomyces variotii]
MSMSAEYSNESGQALDDKYSPNEESSKSQNMTALVADGDVESNNDSKYTCGTRRIAICLTLALALFLPMLDETIVATAVPTITDHFHSLSDVGWYGSAYLIANATLQLPWGKVFTILSVRGSFLVSIAVFEVGSLICALSPSSLALILGRAVAGIGCGGIVVGVYTILSDTLPLSLRPAMIGALGITSGIASACGPVMGGIFTTRLTWRYCFWINLPFGFVAAVSTLIFIPRSKNDDTRPALLQRIKSFDWVGMALLISGLTSLLLAFELGGTRFNWANARIILLFCLAALLLVGFVLVERRLRERGLFPLRIAKQRSIAFGCFYIFALSAAVETLSYYVPIWFQGEKGASALDSGLMSLALSLSCVISAMLTGTIVSIYGQYVPFMIGGSVLLSIGCGLLTTLEVSSNRSHWAPYLFLSGIGFGAGLIGPQTAVPVVLEPQDVALGISGITCAQILGSSIFISAGSNLLNAQLRSGISTGLPRLDVETILRAGATGLRAVVPPADLNPVLDIYNDALRSVFYVCLAMAVTSFLMALGMEWRSSQRGTDGERSAGSIGS